MKTTASIRILSGLFAPLALLSAFSAQATNGLTVLHTFIWGEDGVPSGRLVQGNDGAFYGTISDGGANGMGEVYKVDASGNFSVPHAFSEGPDGYWPVTGLVLMDDGNFYGTTTQACQGNPCTYTGGTMFRMTPDGTLTTIHTFYDSTPIQSVGPITASRDGLLYGLTAWGGPAGKGSAYAMATDGTYIQLGEFNGANGAFPYGALTEGTDGNFYGTTSYGGAYNKGTVFRMAPDGTITTLHDFTGGDDGISPYGTLAQGNDGRFYGAAKKNGGDGYGTLFAITANGELTTLYTFHGGDGTGLTDRLIQGGDGYLYGVSQDGGIDDNFESYGTLFRLSASGKLTTLHLFTPEDGAANPLTGPIFGNDGRLYGTTLQGFTAPPSDATGGIYAFDLTVPRTPELHLTTWCRTGGYECRNVRVGQTVKLMWASANAAYCRASGAWSGAQPIGGRNTYQPTRTGKFLYRLDCVGPNGHASAQVVVTVTR